MLRQKANIAADRKGEMCRGTTHKANPTHGTSHGIEKRHRIIRGQKAIVIACGEQEYPFHIEDYLLQHHQILEHLLNRPAPVGLLQLYRTSGELFSEVFDVNGLTRALADRCNDGL